MACKAQFLVLVPQVPRPLSPHWLLRDLSFQSVRSHDATPLPDGHYRSRNLECLRLAHVLQEDRTQLHRHSRQKAMALCAAFHRSNGDTRIPAHGWRELGRQWAPTLTSIRPASSESSFRYRLYRFLGGAGIVAGAVRNLDLICDASGRLKEWCGAFVVQNHQRRDLSIPQKMLPCLERVRFNYGPRLRSPRRVSNRVHGQI
jgi:hypothetical protein